MRAGVRPLYSPLYPSCLMTPLTVLHIVLGFVLMLWMAADGRLDRALCRKLFSSTCIRTLTKSSGYNSIVEDAPPAIPARKDDIGSIDFLCCSFWCWDGEEVEQCDAAAAEEGEEDGSTTGDGMVMMLCRLWTSAERVSSSLLPGMIHWLLEERRRWSCGNNFGY